MIYLVRVWPSKFLSNGVVEQWLSKELDWIRFDEMTWMVQSVRDANAISQRLMPIVGKNGTCLVIQVDRRNAQGAMAQEFWDWINSRT